MRFLQVRISSHSFYWTVMQLWNGKVWTFRNHCQHWCYVFTSSQYSQRQNIFHFIFLVNIKQHRRGFIYQMAYFRFLMIFVGAILSVLYWGLHWFYPKYRIWHLRAHLKVTSAWHHLKLEKIPSVNNCFLSKFVQKEWSKMKDF